MLVGGTSGVGNGQTWGRRSETRRKLAVAGNPRPICTLWVLIRAVPSVKRADAPTGLAVFIWSVNYANMLGDLLDLVMRDTDNLTIVCGPGT